MTAAPSPEDPPATAGGIGAGELARLESALDQRVRATEAFLRDVYGTRRAVAEGVVSHALLTAAEGFSREAGQVPSPLRWTPLTTLDLARRRDGRWIVVASHAGTLVPWPVATAPPATPAWREHVVDALAACSPPDVGQPLVAVLVGRSGAPTWGAFAQRHGLLAVAPEDLRVTRGRLVVATTLGLVPVHVLLRPGGDDGLDPVVSSECSAGGPAGTAGVPGLLTAVRSGALALVGALGAAVADDPGVRARFGDLVRFHLAEEPLLGDAPFAAPVTATVRALVVVAGDVTRVHLVDPRPPGARPEVEPGRRPRTAHAPEASAWNQRATPSSARPASAAAPASRDLDLREAPRVLRGSLVAEPC